MSHQIVPTHAMLEAEAAYARAMGFERWAANATRLLHPYITIQACVRGWRVRRLLQKQAQLRRVRVVSQGMKLAILANQSAKDALAAAEMARMAAAEALPMMRQMANEAAEEAAETAEFAENWAAEMLAKAMAEADAQEEANGPPKVRRQMAGRLCYPPGERVDWPFINLGPIEFAEICTRHLGQPTTALEVAELFAAATDDAPAYMLYKVCWCAEINAIIAASA